MFGQETCGGHIIVELPVHKRCGDDCYKTNEKEDTDMKLADILAESISRMRKTGDNEPSLHLP